MTKVKFYHAGCPVCVSAEQGIVSALDPTRYEIERVHLGDNPSRIDEARMLGVKTLPALVVEGHVYHINYGASLDDLIAARVTSGAVAEEEEFGRFGRASDCD